MAGRFPLAVVGFAAFVAFGSEAQAQLDLSPDFYLAAGGGLSLLDDMDIEETTTGEEFKTTPFPGFMVTGSLGLDFGLLRLEGEALFTRHSLDDVEGVLGRDLNADGDYEALAGMGNLFLDIPTGIFVTPFVGGGVGYGRVKFDNFSFDGMDIADDKDDAMLYQARAGFAFAVAPSVDLTLGYRYLVIDDVTLDGENGGKIKVDKQKQHIAELGLRITF